MAEHTAAAIECRNLWMVFGNHPEDDLARLQTHEGATTSSIAQSLQDGGFIPAVRDVSFTVAEGELFVIMGLSGSGKSTVVRCLSRLLAPTGGQVTIAGEDVMTAPEERMIELRRKTMGMVFQHFGLFPHMTVLENVAFPLRVQKTAKPERERQARRVIELVGLDGREDAYPRQLSGGQQQRVGIARSLAVNPAIWFLDEPFSALDPLIRRQLQDEFLNLQETLHKSIVFITHDIAEALKLADRIAIMRNGEIVQLGTPAEIVLHPANAYVAEFSKDIPRGRMMTLEAIMSPLSQDATCNMDTAVTGLRVSMNVEAALAAFATNHGAVAVRDGDGKIVGSVTPDALVRALGTEDSP